MPNGLTTTDVTNLERCEQIIERGKDTFVEVGLALTEIRDKKLYRRDYDTFQAYCQERWDFTRRRADQLIKAADTVLKFAPFVLKTNSGKSEELPTKGHQAERNQENTKNFVLISNEGVARALAEIPEAKRTKVLAEAGKGGLPTAKNIKTAWIKIQGPPPPPSPKSTPPPPPAPPAVLDKIGRIIPAELVPMWERREEPLDMIRQLAAIRRTIEDAVKTKDPLYADIGSLQALVDYLTNARSRIKSIVPYTVCPTCQGKLKESCTHCCGTGFIGAFKWQGYAEDMKAIIFKTIKNRPATENEEE